MTKIGKKLAAVLLAVAMAVSLVPVLGTQTAYAEGEDVYTVTVEPGEGTGTAFTVQSTTILSQSDVVSGNYDGKKGCFFRYDREDAIFYRLPTECPFTAPNGKEFDCWKCSTGGSLDAGTFIPIADYGSITITALWKEPEADPYVTLSLPETVNVRYGDTQTAFDIQITDALFTQGAFRSEVYLENSSFTCTSHDGTIPFTVTMNAGENTSAVNLENGCYIFIYKGIYLPFSCQGYINITSEDWAAAKQGTYTATLNVRTELVGGGSFSENKKIPLTLVVPDPATVHSVTVNNGTGSGNYVEGDAVTITANAPESGKKFKEWTGADGLTFTSGSTVTETATFTMPAGDVTVTATYEDIPAPPALIESIEISNLTLPQEGGSPDTTSITTNAKAAGYKVDFVYWIDRDANVVLKPKDIFKAGTKYCFDIKVSPASSGYIFPEDNRDVSVTVNGKSYTCEDSMDIGTALWWCGNEQEWLRLKVYYKVPEQIAVPSGKSLTYSGKSQTGVEAGGNYTVSGNTAVKAGSYTATASLKYKDFDTWTDGTTEDKTIKWTIAPKKVTPAVTLSASAYTYDGKVKKPTVTVKDGSTKLAASDYTVTYKNNKNVGKASAVVTLKGNYSGSKTVTFKINPKGTSLKTLTKASKAVTVKWTKQSTKMSSSRITGYQIQLATDSKFTKNKKTVTVKGYSKVSKKVTGLKGGKKYYVRIRTYMTVSGTNYYSAWSKAMTVSTKK